MDRERRRGGSVAREKEEGRARVCGEGRGKEYYRREGEEYGKDKMIEGVLWEGLGKKGERVLPCI